jgi:hypothetical protein
MPFEGTSLLPLDDYLTFRCRRCLQLHGSSGCPGRNEGSPKRKLNTYPIGYFHIDIAEVRTSTKTHGELRALLRDLVDASNFARRLKALGGLTSYELICKVWASQPQKIDDQPAPHKGGTKRLGGPFRAGSQYTS